MTLDLADQVALVTGAGQGIGRASALAMAEAGAHVIAADIAGPHAEATRVDETDWGVPGKRERNQSKVGHGLAARVAPARGIWLLPTPSLSFLSLPLGWHDGCSFAALVLDGPMRGSE
jgi:NAD(P)-dependent dehydrogenase (short-subunit alcohol dehydrogenase family)